MRATPRRMLPILPLLFLLLFPHAATLRAVEAGQLGGRHELRLLVRAVETAREEETASLLPEAGVREPRSLPPFADDEFRTLPNAADRVRDGPLS